MSVYNGAGKIETFLAGLERFTREEKSITEFIFVDSASADDTGRALPERLELAATRGIGALYMRSHQRETIQRAWNRGIAAARGEYLAFLGVDEMDRPGSLAKMADFLDRRRMGYIESRNRVIGFEPHAFGQIPSIGLKQQEAEPWQLIRLELISLLRHPEPVA